LIKRPRLLIIRLHLLIKRKIAKQINMIYIMEFCRAVFIKKQKNKERALYI